MALKERTSWQVQKAVWKALFIRALNTKVGDHFLGPLWLITEPLIHIATLTIIFSFIRDRNDFQGVPFAAFFAAGILPFFIFQHSVNKSLVSMRQNRQLFSYRQILPLDIVLSTILVETFIYILIILILIFVGFWFFQIEVIPHKPLEIVLVFGLLFMLTLGNCCFCAVLGARWENATALLIQFPLRLLYFISGIIIPLQELPVHLHKYLLWNPLLHAIEQIRVATFEGYLAPGTSISYLALFTIFNLFLGLAFFNFNRSKILILR